MTPSEVKLSDIWVPASNITAPDRYSIDLWGGGGGGKTHFIVMTAPMPLFVINFDRNVGHLVAKAKDAGRNDIFVRTIHTEGLIGDLDDRRVVELVKRFDSALAEAVKQPCGTLAVDGGSALANLMERHALIELNKSQRAAGKEEFDKLPALHRGSINAKYNAMLASVSNSPLNFIITHQQRELWNEKGQPTGVFESRENSQVEYGVDIAIRMFAQWQSAGKGQPASLMHAGKITMSKIKEDLVGMVIPNLTWEYLIGLMEE